MDILSETQIKVMRYIKRNDPNGCSVQIAGNGRAPWLSACRSLAKRGMVTTWRSGYYKLTEYGEGKLADYEQSVVVKHLLDNPARGTQIA
jgi:hypothetical protein